MDSDSADDAPCAGCGGDAGDAAQPEQSTAAGNKRKSPNTPSVSSSHESSEEEEAYSEDEGEGDAEKFDGETFNEACRSALVDWILIDGMSLSIGEKEGFNFFAMVLYCSKIGDYMHDHCKKALVHMIIKDGMPFKTVEGEGFKQFVNTLEPRFEVPSWKTIYRDVLSMYMSFKPKMKDYFAEHRPRVCLTIDTWRSIQNLNYMRVTAQFIDHDWKMQKRIINFCQIESRNGVDIGKTLEKCLLEWGLIDRVFTVTLDKSSANDEAIEYLKNTLVKNGAIMNAEFLQVRCAAHVLAHVVKDGLKKYQKSISTIRAVVKYVMTRSCKFRECVAKENIELKRGVFLDEKNRWNSTYLMLEAAVKFEKAFQRLEKEETKFFRKFCSSASTSGPTSTSTSTPTVDKEASTHDIEDASSSDSESDEDAFNSDSEPDEEASAPGKDSSSSDSEFDKETSYAEDWGSAKNFAKFLKVFFDATVKLTASTSDSFLWEHCLIHKQLSSWDRSNDPFSKNMATTVLHKYNKYRGSYEDMNPFLFIAVLLDPREKELGLKFRLDVLCENDEDLAVKLMGRVKSVLQKLYEEYKLLYSGAENVGAETSNLHDTEVKNSDDAEALLRQRLEKLKDETVEYKSEVDRYLAETCECTRANPQFVLLNWWKTNSSKYIILSHIARDILAIPVSSITPKSAFNTGMCVLDEFRSCLPPRAVEALIFMQSWLCGTTDLDLSGLVDDYDDEDEDTETAGALMCMRSWLPDLDLSGLALE